MKELVVLLNGSEAGTLRNAGGKPSFAYADSWRASADAYPLSVSMPLSAREHSHKSVEPFIWGLLPDNDAVLRSWGKKFQVSPRNAFALLSHVGEDCAGAVQFVQPNRIDRLLPEAQPEPDWLTERELAERLRLLRTDASAGRLGGDRGQFSLAGAQPKTALFFDGTRWGATSGRTATTHILKPASDAFPGHAENEHVCMNLASALGLETAKSTVLQFEDVTAISVERYDRIFVRDAAEKRMAHAQQLQAEAMNHSTQGGSGHEAKQLEEEAAADFDLANRLFKLAETTYVARMHQEDFCQALNVHPANKYQNEGGPGPRQIIEVMRSNIASHGSAQRAGSHSFAADDDVATFVGALILNWLIGGTDAHAKNYALLIGGGGMVRLAPLYDMASVLPYAHIDPRKAKLAMKIGDHYGLTEISFADWRKLATSIRVDGDALIERIKAMAREIPDRLSDEIRTARHNGLKHKVLDNLQGVLTPRAAAVAAM